MSGPSDLAQITRDAAIEAGWTPVDPVYAWAYLVYTRGLRTVESLIWNDGKVNVGSRSSAWKLVPIPPRTPEEWKRLAETMLATCGGTR